MTDTEVKIKKKRKLPRWFKAIFLKFWFAGMVYFFIGWGLFISTTDQLDVTLAIGLTLGIVTDVVVNRIFRNMEHGKSEYHFFMMFPRKALNSFFLNVLYAVVLSFAVAYTYNFINIIAISIKNLPDTTVVLGAEPILFGLLCMAYDMILLQIKKVFVIAKSKKLKSHDIALQNDAKEPSEDIDEN